MNPENPDPKKVNQLSLLIIDINNIRKETVSNVINRSLKMADHKAIILLISKKNKF